MASKSQLTLDYYKDEAGEHRWRLLSRNGKIIGASSEGYKRRAMAVKNSAVVITAGGTPGGIKIVADGQVMQVDTLQFIETAKSRK